MPRSVRSPIESRSARLRLPGRKAPFWVTLQRGLAIGYHRPIQGGAGAWWGRRLVASRYQMQSLALADNYADADGSRILDWAGAQAAVRSWAEAGHSGPLTVEHAVALYISDLRVRRGEQASKGALERLRKHFLSAFPGRRLASISHAEWVSWQASLVRSTGSEDAIRKSRDTGNRTLNIARAVANFSFRTGLVTDDRNWRRVRPFRAVGEFSEKSSWERCSYSF